MSYVRNPGVEWLLSRSYGQGGGVALPDFKKLRESDVLGDFPAGVNDVLLRMKESHNRWEQQATPDYPVEWCFLIGGPGNGKSEALRALASTLQIELPTRGVEAPAPRSVPDSWPDSATPIPHSSSLEIVFINDASIPRAEALEASVPGSLLLDIRDGLGRLLDRRMPVILFANVNRGILVEEQARLSRLDPNQDAAFEIAAKIIEWLVNTPESSSSNPQLEPLSTTVPFDPRHPYYAQFTVPLKSRGASHDLISHVVFLDVLSLLEPAPGRGLNAIKFPDNGLSPEVSRYQPFGRLSSDGAERENTVAGKLLEQLVNAEKWEQGGCVAPDTNLPCEALLECPFAENAKWLKKRELARTFLDLLRSVEIAASRRITYRDLLGHLSLALLGSPEESWLKDQHPCEWVEVRTRAIKHVDSTTKKTAVAELIGHRLYNNLFPPVDADGWRKLMEPALAGDSLYKVAAPQSIESARSSRARAFTTGFNTIDPARDVEPWGEKGLRRQALESIESLDTEPPSEGIRSFLTPEALSRLEQLLDEAVRDEIAGEISRNPAGRASKAALNRVKFLRKWRSTLLLRQVGLATGNFSFKHAVSLWLAEQENALSERDHGTLGDGIRALVLPSDKDGRLVLAPLRPRTYGLSRDKLPTNTLLVSVSLRDLYVDIVPQGDILTAVVISSKEQKTIASLVIDLAIAREAALNVNARNGSFTEIGASSFARIERVRASLIGRRRLERAPALYTDNLGNLYRIRLDPMDRRRLKCEQEN